AVGQCDWSISGVPDFDQRRLETPTVPGLPGNGAMYCVPTSMSNWLAYLADRGYPAAFGGAHNWSGPGVYDLVTARIALLGQLIGTDATSGSGLGGLESGLTAYLFLYEPG